MSKGFEFSYHTIVFILSFIIAVTWGIIVIPLLRRLKFGQTVRDDGPSTHLKKTGTPTIGGLIFYLPVLFFSILYVRNFPEILALVIAFFAFGIIGLTDDLIKVLKKSKDGLTPMQKTVLQFLAAAGFVLYFAVVLDLGSDMILPFTGMTVSIRIPPWIYYPFLVLVLYFISNSVNLTDGVDGLCGGISIFVLLFFALVAKKIPNFEYAIIFNAALTGGLLGFLVYNLHPARVFMGDTGSLALGGVIAALAILMKIPWVLLIAGIIYILESLSVIIQVAYFKRTGKRVFKMSPIHHHFELSGWKEVKVVYVFWAITLIGCILSFLTLF